jgi:glucokinase
MHATIGIDVGATTTSAGIVTGDGRVISAVSAPTREHPRTNPVDALLKLVSGRVADAQARGMVLDGIGIGLPGLVDVAKGMMIDSVNFVPELGQVPLADLIRAETGLPVFVDNDVNALALAEHTFGVARDADSLALLAIGTGPGGALIIGDMLVRGHAGCAGEFGHMPIMRDGAPCPCGLRGCLHTVAGGYSIEARGRELARGPAGTALRALAGNDPITAATVFAAAAAGDTAARAIVDDVCRALGSALATIINAINPEVVVLTGGVARSLVSLDADVRRHVADHALPRALASTRLHIVPGDKTRTVLGGAALVRYELARANAPRPSRR